MPFVTCPDCGRESTAPRELIGLEWNCPKCGTSFIVTEDQVPRGTPRRKKRHANNTGRWIILGVLLLATVAASVWAGARWSRPRVQMVDAAGNPTPSARTEASEILPSPPDGSGEGPDWTYREMLDYLRSRGLPLKMGTHNGNQFFMLTDRDDVLAEAILLWDAYGRKTTVVTCIKTNSAKQAKELAGTSEKGVFSWCRWVFQGDDETLRLFRHALTERTPVTERGAEVTFDNLLARMRSKGMVVKMKPFKDGRDGRIFILTDSEDEATQAMHLFGGDDLPPGADLAAFQKLAPRAAACIKYRFAVQSKGVHDTSTTQSFAWGRFAFSVRSEGSDTLEQIRRALGSP